MKHTKKYLDALFVAENEQGYDERDVVHAKRYCNAYMEGYNQALSIADVVKSLPTGADIETASFEYATKMSSAPDKETPDWIQSDFKAGVKWAIEQLTK